jgi:hypothetical protein
MLASSTADDKNFHRFSLGWETKRPLKTVGRKAAGSWDTEAYVLRYVEVDERPRTQREAIFSAD